MPGANLRGPPPLRQYPPGRYCNRSRCGGEGSFVVLETLRKARSPRREGRRAVSSEPPTLPPPSLPCLRAWAAEHQGGNPSQPCLLAGKEFHNPRTRTIHTTDKAQATASLEAIVCRAQKEFTYGALHGPFRFRTLWGRLAQGFLPRRCEDAGGKVDLNSSTYGFVSG